MPLDGEQLVIEPRYPFAEGLGKIGQAEGDREVRRPELVGATVVNCWFNSRKGCDIYLVRRADGKLDWGFIAAVHSLDKQLRTLGCSDAWGIEQESKALQLLATLLPHRHFKQYMLTGSFLETSKRSGVTYMFRRLRPTVAIGLTKDRRSTRFMAALCLHPIGYYADSWAGSMCPTDDVIAHLTLMRGDEPMFWRRANQHPSWRPEAGI